MKNISERIYETRKQANRETQDLPNQIRADIMNNTRLAVSLVIAKDRALHEIYVNATFIDGNTMAWKYIINLVDFQLDVRKIYLNIVKLEKILSHNIDIDNANDINYLYQLHLQNYYSNNIKGEY